MDFYEEAEKYFIAGMKCYLDKDYEGVKKYFTKAIDGYSEVIKSGKGDISVYDNRGFAYMCTEKYIEAKDDFTKVIELDANNKKGYADRGFVYLRIKDYSKAIDDFIEAIKLGANDKFIYGGRGSAYIGIEDYPKAIEDFSKAVKLDENNKNAYFNRGLVYLYIKDYQKAIEDFTQVVKLNKNDDEKNNTTSDSVYISSKIELTDNIFDLIPDILQNNKSKVLLDDETLNLIELICFCYDLMEEVKINPSDVEEEKIVHYTKASTVQYLLQKDHKAKLRLNNAVYMNDPEEGQILKKVLCQLDKNNELENLFKDGDVKNYTYLTCFSLHNERNELPMWVHYGDGGNGVGLVFNHSFFDKTDLYKVQYMDVNNPDIKKLNENVQEKITAILNLLQEDGIRNNTRKEFKDYVNIILNYVSYLFKDKAYEYENEVRILNYRDYAGSDISTVVSESGIPRLFIEYDECITDKNCVEVIVGPKANYTEIAAYVKYVGIQKVSQSEIKYR